MVTREIIKKELIRRGETEDDGKAAIMLTTISREIGIKTGLRYVYTGNVPGEEGENTFCYNCGQIVIKRWGYNILEYNIHNGRCKFCSAEIDGVGL